MLNINTWFPVWGKSLAERAIRARPARVYLPNGSTKWVKGLWNLQACLLSICLPGLWTRMSAGQSRTKGGTGCRKNPSLSVASGIHLSMRDAPDSQRGVVRVAKEAVPLGLARGMKWAPESSMASWQTKRGFEPKTRMALRGDLPPSYSASLSQT